MVKIDLNADLGEGSNADAALMTLVSSVNIACGFHAGDAQTMLASVRNAMKNGVAITPAFRTGKTLVARRWIWRLRRFTRKCSTRSARWRR